MTEVYAQAVKDMENQHFEPQVDHAILDRRESTAPSLTDAATIATTSGVLTPTEPPAFSTLGGYVSSKRKFANTEGYDFAEHLSSAAKKRRSTTG